LGATRHLSKDPVAERSLRLAQEDTGIPRRRHPQELPIDPLEDTIRRLRSSARMLADRRDGQITHGQHEHPVARHCRFGSADRDQCLCYYS
jgi:hypothetical protein